MIHRNRQNGFTLAELLVSVAVASIVLTVAAPSWESLTLNNRQVTSVNELVGLFHFARTEAVTRNRQVTLCPSADGANCAATPWQSGAIVFIDSDNDRAVGPGETILRVSSALDAVDISTANFAQVLVFRSNGRISTGVVGVNSGQFTLCDRRGAEHARVIVMEISGRPHASGKQADGSDPTC